MNISKLSAELCFGDQIKHLAHSSLTTTLDGREMYWSTVSENESTRKIYMSNLHKGKWTERRLAPFSGVYHDDQPFITPDGKYMYFASFRPTDKDSEERLRLWRMKRLQKSWSNPEEVLCPNSFWTPTVTNSGTLYFLGQLDSEHKTSRNTAAIYRCEQVDGKFIEPEMLPHDINLEGALNWCPFIDPNEDYLIFSSNREGSSGSGDLYISFRHNDDSWSQVINMGKVINTDQQERFPGLSRNGEYLYFTRSCSQDNLHDLYRIDSRIISIIKETYL